MSAVLEQVEYVSIERAIPMRRVWAMPNPSTFDIPPIRALVKSYLHKSFMSVDPFARNKRWAMHTNDLNPETAAEHHLDARVFLNLLHSQGVVADLVLCDPPYSQVQVSRAYNSVGREYKPFGDDNNAVLYREVKDGLDKILRPGGLALCFGWNSAGFGLERGYSLDSMLIVCHGGAHNDTIVTVERKVESRQVELF